MSKMMDTDKIGKLAKKLDDRAAAKVQLEEDRAVAAENALDTKINEKADKIYYESLGNSDTLTNDDIVQSSPTGIVMYNRPLNLVDGKKYVVDIIANNENIKFVSPIARTITFVGSNIVAFEKELTIDNVNIYIAVFDTVGISASGNALEYNKNSCSIGYNNISNVTSITFTEIISTEEVNSDLLLNQRFITEEERSKWNNKQDKTDNTLNTEDKTIVGAINELESEVFDITANVISMDAYKADKTYVDEQISNITNNNITEAELDLLLEEIFGINSKNELTSVRLGNYQMKYDNVNDTLDFLYNGVIGEPMEEIIPLAWVVGNLSGTDGSETEQSSTLRTGFVTIEDNYDYSFYLDTSMSDPGGIRVYFYDSNKTFISRTDGDTIGYITGSYNSIYMPNNAAYMRFKSNVSGTTTINNINSLFTLRKRKSEVNNYVREGLSMYIDANDVATYGSVRDITGKQTVTNHGATLTSDNKYLNFVASESDYLGTDFVPNLTQWSAEMYFQYTSMPTASQAIFSWGVASDNNIRLAYSNSTSAITMQSNAGTNYPIISDSDEIVKPHHLIITKNNGTIITYLDGVKSVLSTDAAVQNSHDGTLVIGCRYGATKYFANINLRMFRFYDGKVLSDVEALQNYNYETKNNYVTNGLSMYIDADDVATYGSIRDITGKQSITNHGVSTTLDNGCLNFVRSESDYIDCGFKPNLTKWSLEYNFYLTEIPNINITMIGWGASGNRTSIGIWGDGSTYMIAINDNTAYRICAKSLLLSLVHIILTYDNGKIIAYVNGEKSQIATNVNVMTSQASNLMIGTKYSADEFTDMHLKSLRFYDGKVLTDEEALQNYKYETKVNSYVREGLSMYIDASHDSITDVTGNHTITNHGVTHTSDNNYLNFVASESDYLDTDLLPNLSTWSAELYFYFTGAPTGSQVILGWGSAGENKFRIAYSKSYLGLVSQSNIAPTRVISTESNLLEPHHLIVTKNNGVVISYLDGVKTELCTDDQNQSSQAGTLKIGTKYDASTEFANINLRMFRFYDGKVLTDKEALQNYNYETKVNSYESNRNSSIIKPTWIYNKKPDSTTGELVDNENNACTEFIPYDSSYIYTLDIDTVAFFRVYYYDNSQSYIKNDSIADNFNGVITPPENTVYMRLKLSRNNVEFTDLDNHVIFRKSLKFVLNPTWIDNRNINVQGVEFDETSAMITDYLTKEDGYNYTINLTSVSSVKIYFFNSSKTFISRTDNLTVDSTDILIEFPENTSYFRVKSDKGTATVDNANDYIILKKVAK